MHICEKMLSKYEEIFEEFNGKKFREDLDAIMIKEIQL